MRCASALRWPWLVMGSVPPVDSMTISAQKTPVEMWTEATFEIGMLSSLLPKNRDFTRATRCALTVSLVGKKKLPCVQRLAEKVSLEFGSVARGVLMVSSAAAELALRRTAGGGYRHMNRGGAPMRAASTLDPFERAFFPHPDVTDDQDSEEDHHLKQAEQAEGFEPHRPGKKKNRLHVEHHE